MIINTSTSLQTLRSFFDDDSAFTSIDLPEVIRLDTNSSDPLQNGISINNNNIKSIKLPSMEQSPFILCGDNLQEVDLSHLIRIEFTSPYLGGYEALPSRILQNTKIQELILPNFTGTTGPYATDIGSSNAQYTSFWNNYWLKRVDLGNEFITQNNNVYFNGLWFRNNYFLTALVLRYPFVIALNTRGGFNTTPIGAGLGKIYVPNNLLNSYRTATNWSEYNSNIVSIDELSAAINQDSITDSWETIIYKCNNGGYETYPIGGTKTVKINGIPTQMVIVDQTSVSSTGRQGDPIAGENKRASLVWMERTISRFATESLFHSFTGNTKQYSEATVYRNIFSTLFAGIEEPALTASDGIKTVTKTARSYTSESLAFDGTSEDKLWPPSLAELGAGNATPYAYYRTNKPYYTLGDTNLITNTNNINIAIGLRDYAGWSYNYPITLQQKTNPSAGEDPMGVNYNNTNAYAIFGFCT